MNNLWNMNCTTIFTSPIPIARTDFVIGKAEQAHHTTQIYRSFLASNQKSPHNYLMNWKFLLNGFLRHLFPLVN